MTSPAARAAYTVAVIGDADAGALHAVTEALAAAVASDATSGRVVAGDYLEKTGRDDPGASFHIGCFRDDAVVDVLKCPASLRNLAGALGQLARIVWVVCPGEISDNLKTAMTVSRTLGVSSHALLSNLAKLDPELADDEELVEVLGLETGELLDTAGIDTVVSLEVSIDGSDAAAEAASLGPLAKWLFDSWPEAPAAAGASSGAATLAVESSYGVQGPGGKPVRVAFGPISGGTIATGDELTLLGGDAEPSRATVSEVQLFGEKIDAAPANASAALMLYGAKPKTGQILTAAPDRCPVSRDAELKLVVGPGKSAAELLSASPSLELHFGFSVVFAQVTRLTPEAGDDRAANLSVRIDREVALADRQPVCVGSGADLVAGGWLEPAGV